MSNERYTILKDYHGDVKYIMVDKPETTTQVLETPNVKRVSLSKPTDRTIKPIVNLSMVSSSVTIHNDKPVCLTKPEDILQTNSTPKDINTISTTPYTTQPNVTTRIRVTTTFLSRVFTLKGAVMSLVFIVMAVQLPILDILSIAVAMLLFNAMPLILVWMALSTYKNYRAKQNYIITEEEFETKLKEKTAILVLAVVFIVVSVIA